MKVGPLLGVENESTYTVCFLSDNSVISCDLAVEGIGVFKFQKLAVTPSGQFWKAKFLAHKKTETQTLTYEVCSTGNRLESMTGVTRWSFHIPGAQEKPRIAYTSCNGFSSAKYLKKVREPYFLWNEMRKAHERSPFSLLIMGGDQLYADDIWESNITPTIAQWGELSRSDRIAYTDVESMEAELDVFYETLYVKRWSNPSMAQMMATVPSVMMWDDHDIFEGWGSYKSDLQNCPVFQQIFHTARRYFDLFQLRGLCNKTLLSRSTHRPFGLQFHDYLILGLDNRSERMRSQVMSPAQWHTIKDWLATKRGEGKTLLVLSAIPVVYRSFAGVESVFAATSWEEELDDDILDHWSAREHQGERMRLIMNLLRFAEVSDNRVVILSGDVHVGALGIIKDTQRQLEVHQVISSGIVHPPPSVIEWLGLCAVTGDQQERIGNGQITTEMICPFGSDRYIRTRNYVTLEEGNDKKIWVSWFCEGDLNPEYVI